MSNKTNLDISRRRKNDEYYTKYSDVVKGLNIYLPYIKGKKVLCNCDTEDSNFVKYLREIGCDVITYHTTDGNEFYTDCDYDICITNPPFSKIKDFYNAVKHKPFIMLCNFNHLCYKDLFVDFIEHRLNIGYSVHDMTFNTDSGDKCVSLCMFVSNLAVIEDNESLEVHEQDLSNYQLFDNTDILNVDKTKDIPINYNGLMGIPISYIVKHDKTQFEIVGIAKHGKDHKYDICKPIVNGKEKFTRLIIRRITND